MRRESLPALGFITLILLALAAKALLLPTPPAHGSPSEFDAHRAKARLAFVLGDQRPHPADSEANDLVRQRIVTLLQQMGLKPVVRDAMTCNDFRKARLVACARVRNIIAIVGPPSGKALLLSAHYDSVPAGPGAADDGIGVASLLEVASIVKTRPLRRPVMFLFNEGEELGLIGARNFLADPLSRNVDSVLNFEARGVNGPVTMFETNHPNGPAMTAYAASVPHPFASSLSTDIARLIPNDTDVTTYKERQWLTLNFGIIGNETRYHSPGDDLAGLDVRSLQDMGDSALALTLRLSAGLPQATGDRIFSDLAQRAFVIMPLSVGVICLVFLLAAFGFLAWKRGALVRGVALTFAAIVVAGFLSWLAATAMGAIRTGNYWRAQPEITYLAIYATALLGELAVFRTLGARIATAGLRAACWFALLLLGGALALVAPGGIIYFLIPPAILLIGTAIGGRWVGAEKIAAILAVLFLYLSWSELLGGIEELFSPGPVWIVAPVAAIMMAPALVEANDLLSRASRRLLLASSALLALIGWIAAGAAPAYSQDHQQRFTIEHVTEFPTGKSRWSIVNDGARLPAAYSSIGSWHRGKLEFSERQRWFTRAPALPNLRPPSLQLLEMVRNGAERTMRVRLAANGAERISLVAPEKARIRTAGVPGFIRPIASEDSDGKYTITCTGRSCDGMELTIDLLNASPVTFNVVGARNGLPPSAEPLLRGRPQFARPQYVPDETLAIDRVNL